MITADGRGLMGFDESIAALIQRIPKIIDHLKTEEATKNALVMPFIAALGYDVFSPREVVPEFVADVGTKKGEKVDYAILHEDDTAILFECKKVGVDLSHADMSQLYRYFSVTSARIGVLTNGVEYRFFSDLEQPNVMDKRPFLELNLLDSYPGVLSEVRKLSKGQFDIERMLSTANELKYTTEIKKALAKQIDEPQEDFVRLFFGLVNPGGRFTAAAKIQFSDLVKKACAQLISEKVSDRLRTALETADVVAGRAESTAGEATSDADQRVGVKTTEDELEGFRIVRAIVCQAVSPERVVHRDTKTYMGVLLDDTNRKPICRLWFNSSQKYIGVFDAEKNETRVPIQNLSDIYLLSDRLLEAVRHYEGTQPGASTDTSPSGDSSGSEHTMS